MNLMMKHLIVIILLMMIMMLMMMLLAKKTIMDWQKSTPFECGFNPMTFKRMSFSVHFFLIAVIFLIFDIEIIIVLPMTLTLKSSMIVTWVTTSTMFIAILIMGLYHEWINGMLKWTN
uniref:NADH-ubiquinone oxidoreductase chain 3 n=1 Tax=Eurhadina exclamationis TaxID=2892960 RepID=A0A9E6XQE0_9HEMI|nr:NADH dehydrogenase subunit 3 [Eurhadina exclamationis]UGN61504.1 NADH dehydrogenase subunit 3 [Eurhadina exclamationis]